MIKLIAIVTLSICITASATSPVVDGAIRAKKEGKKLLLYFWSEKCGMCTLLKEQTFEEPEVASFLKKNIVIIPVNTIQNKSMAKKYAVQGIPCLIFFEPLFQEMDRIIGYQEPANFMKSVSDIMNGRNTFLSLQEKVCSGKAGPNDLILLADKYADRWKNGKAKEILLEAKKAGISKNELLYVQGKIEKNNRKFNKSAELIEAAIIDSHDVKKLYTLCECYFYAKDYTKCIHSCNRLIRADTGNSNKRQPFGHYLKGYCFKLLGLQDDSVRTWKMLAKKFPDDFFASLARQALNQTAENK